MANWIPILRRRGCSVLFYSYINQGYKDAYYQEVLGLPVGVNQHIYIDGWVVLDLDDAAQFTRAVGPRFNHPQYVEFFLRHCHDLSNDLFTFGLSLRERDFGSLSNGELLATFAAFSSRTIRLIPFLTSIVQLQDLLESRLKTALGAASNQSADSPEVAQQLGALLVQTNDLPLATRSVRELRKIATSIQLRYPRLATALQDADAVIAIASALQADYPDVAETISTYLECYDFLATDYYLGEPFGVTDVLTQVGGLLKANDRGTPDPSDKTADPVLDDHALFLLRAARQLHYLRQHRIEALFKSGRDARSLFLEIGARIGLVYDELMALQFAEIMDSLAAGELVVDFALLTTRMRDFGVLILNGSAQIVVGDELQGLRSHVTVNSGAIDVLSGITAVAGTAEGRARVVTILDDVARMETGEVLIAPMTSPYHVQAMTRASAIVTDEGGILSHAAIISRELGVPCIVGAARATELIRTGDLVRVAARPAGGHIEILERGAA